MTFCLTGPTVCMNNHRMEIVMNGRSKSCPIVVASVKTSRASIVGLVALVLAVPALAEESLEPAGRWPYGPISSVAASGRHLVFGSGAVLLVADLAQGVHVIDVTTPASPVAVGLIETEGLPLDITIVNGFAFVADSREGLLIIDVSTPSSPVEVGTIGTPGRAMGVSVSGGYACVAADEAGLRVIDVRDPHAPIEVGFLDTPGFAGMVVGCGESTYLADGRAGLRVIDAGTPKSPAALGSHLPPSRAPGTENCRGLFYVDQTPGGVEIVQDCEAVTIDDVGRPPSTPQERN